MQLTHPNVSLTLSAAVAKPLTVVASTKKAVAVLKGTAGVEGVVTLSQDSDAKKVFSVMDDKDVVSWNTLIGGLVKANRLSEARQLFDEMPERDMVSWNTILDGYAKAGQLNDALYP